MEPANDKGWVQVPRSLFRLASVEAGGLLEGLSGSHSFGCLASGFLVSEEPVAVQICE